MHRIKCEVFTAITFDRILWDDVGLVGARNYASLSFERAGFLLCNYHVPYNHLQTVHY